jgi:hypothetical protein
MPDAEQKIPAIGPQPAHTADRVTSLDLSKKGKNDNKQKCDQGKDYKPDGCVNAVNDPEKTGPSLH